jgi:hypothetical protein
MLLFSIFVISGVFWKIKYEDRTEIAHAQIRSFKDACDLYFDRYDILPSNGDIDTDQTITTGDPDDIFLNSCLMGMTSERNRYRTSFLDSGKSSYEEIRSFKKEVNGWVFLDPWGNPFFVRFDYDGDGEITDPATGKIHKKKGQLIWSSGPDGKTGTPETTKDDIRSWKNQ